MARVSPFRAQRFHPDRVSLRRVVADPAAIVDDAARAALVAREPRNVAALLARTGEAPRFARDRVAFLLANLVRARVVRGDDAPSLYAVRTRARGVDEVPLAGFFAVVSTGSEVKDARPRASLAVRVPRLAFDDDDGRVMRVVRADVSERDPDATIDVGDADEPAVDVWVVDDETSCARVSDLLFDRALRMLDDVVDDGAPFIAFLVPDKAGADDVRIASGIVLGDASAGVLRP